MTPAEREIARQRRRLLLLESNGQSEIVRSYEAIRRDLKQRLVALTRRIVDARAAGIETRPAWLSAEDRYRSLLQQHEEMMLRFLAQALSSIEGTKRGAVVLAADDAPALAKAVMGPAPAAAEAVVDGSFSRLPSSQIDQMIRNAADGRPLGLLLAEVAPETTEALRNALMAGVARGAPVREIARDARKAAGIAQSRAQLIARTEVIRVYRETSLAQFQRSQVVRGWVWYAEPDACMVCLANHGTEHTASEQLTSHPACRCSMVPKTLSWGELGFDVPDGRPRIDTGAERFARLSEGDKLAVLGRTRLEAYNRGDISLDDLFRPTHHPRWGEGKRAATLKELGLQPA